MDRGTAVARKRVEDAERVIGQVQKDITNAEKVAARTSKPKPIFEQILNDTRNSQSILISSNDEKN
jgi:type II secretory pathway component PulJ